MVDFVNGYFRRSIFKAYRFLKHPRKLKQSPTMRWFARHFLDKHVWKPTQHTFAGGMAVGLFVTVQLLPIQMPTAAILAAVFRVNIPIALILCWASNPATLAPIAWVENMLGTWLMHHHGLSCYDRDYQGTRSIGKRHCFCQSDVSGRRMHRWGACADWLHSQLHHLGCIGALESLSQSADVAFE